MKNIMLVGLGPHAKRIYFNYFEVHKIYPKILVELESNYDNVNTYLKENNYTRTKIWCLPDKYKDNEKLPIKYEKLLEEVCRKNKITHIITSTEPKAHNMYLQFALKHNINILSDKPITVLKGMNNIEVINKVRKQYYDLLKIYNKEKCSCKIMCQRQYHRGYIYIKELIKDIVSKYNIPITYIDIYHCDGNWEMPHDLDKENHPYKYGYGKLYHSGYHFIDLLTELLKLNDLVSEDKRITFGYLYANSFAPEDEMVVFNNNDYINIFKDDNVKELYNHFDDLDFSNYGEKNVYAQLNFLNNKNKIITTANLNLLHYGFSRRGWFKSRDYYKKNGRIRHERINIQIGPLMNIQVHSYQSKEVKDRTNDDIEFGNGGLEHFDIDIYRNISIIGGKPFERIKLKNLYDDKVIRNNFIGYNEYSREEFLNSFLENYDNKGDLKEQKQSIEILHSLSKAIYVNKKKMGRINKIKIVNEE